MKAGTQNHVKVKRLKRLLGVPLYRAVGILETLWLLCIDCCDEGDIGKFSDDEIADYLEWDGDPSVLVRALSDAGWTDPDTERRLVVHDWLQHCPEYIKERVRKREARAAKAAKRVGIDEIKRLTGDAGRTNPDTTGQGPDQTRLVPSIPNPTQPNPTNSNPTQPIHSSASADGDRDQPSNGDSPSDSGSRTSKHAYTAAFERWYATYPRKVGKEAAAAAFGRAIQKIMLIRRLDRSDALSWLCGVTEVFGQSKAGNAGSYTPHPATWLNSGRYDDEPGEWERERTADAAKDRAGLQRVGPGQRFHG